MLRSPRVSSLEIRMGRAASVGMSILACFFAAAVLATGCRKGVKMTSNFTPPQRSGFVSEEFLTYGRVAILPFEGDASGDTADHFTRRFREKFRNIEVIDQHLFSLNFRREDLFPDRLTEATRIRISEMFGVQAVIAGSIFYPNFTTWQLRIRVIDTESGDAIGGSSVEMRNMGAEGMVQACMLAVQQLTPR
jgi:hypothetical protein